MEACNFQINWKMFPCKIACFLTGSFYGCSIPFLNVFFTSVGMSEVRAGMLTAMMYCSCIIAGPAWGILADYTQRRKSVLIILCMGSTVTMFCIPWIAHIVAPSARQCNQLGHNATSEINGLARNGTSLESKNFSSTVDEVECNKLKAELSTSLFRVLLGAVLIAALFFLPLFNYFEAIVMNVSKSNEEDYGTQRIFGSVGLSFGSFLAGEACEHFSVSEMSEYSPIFFMSAICTAALIPLGCYIIEQGNYDDDITTSLTTTDETEAIERLSVWREVMRVCSHLDFILFLVTVFISGLSNMVFLNFSFKFALETMERGNSQTSYVIVCSAIGGLTAFPFATRFITLFRGTIPAIIIGLLTWFLRLILMSFRIPFEVFVCIQLLNGLSFAVLFAALMQHVFVVSPKHINLTINSITLALFFYLSAIVANIGGSSVYKQYGGTTLFLGISLCCGAWAVVMMLYLGLHACARNTSARPIEQRRNLIPKMVNESESKDTSSQL